jgi:hypothetical protein
VCLDDAPDLELLAVQLRSFPSCGCGQKGRMFGLWRRRGEKNRADKQQGDPHALAREGDPRGGTQSDEYRHVGPTQLVEEDGRAISGPAGAPHDA